MVTFDPREVWERVEWADGRPPSSPTPRSTQERDERRRSQRRDKRRAGRARLLRDLPACCRGPPSAANPGHCPRCGAALVWRRPHSDPVHVGAGDRRGDLLRTGERPPGARAPPRWASTESDTIMGGVIFLYASGSWPLALIVLVASVMIPLGKLVALALSADHGAAWLDREQPRPHADLLTWSNSSADGRCSTCSSTRSSLRSCNSQPLMSVEPGLGSCSSWWWSC